MKRILTLILLAFSLSGFGQVYKTVTMALDTGTNVAKLRAGTQTFNLTDSFANYTPLQDGLVSGGSATIGTGSVTIDTAYYRINKVNYMSLPRTFTGISNSASGTQYYILIYGKNDNTLDTLQGVQDTIATIPTKPIGTVSINTVLVGDGGVESAAPDFSGYAKTDGNNINASSFRSALDLSTYYVSKTVSDTKTGNLSINGNLSSISSIRTTGYDNPGYSSGKGIEFRYDTANDRGSFLSYDRDNNLLKPMIFQATNYLFGDAIGTPGKLGINVNPPAYDLDVKGDVNIGSGSVYRINGIALSYENPLTFASPLSRSTNTISIPPATTSESGYLTSTDWNTFNNKANTNGSNATGIWGINISGNAGSATNWGGISADFSIDGDVLVELVGRENLTGGPARGYSKSKVKGWLDIPSGGETLQSVTDRGANTTNGASFGGNVGIGTTTPSAKLDVNGTGYFSNKLSLSAGTTSNSSFRIPNGVAPTTPVSGDWWSLTTGLRTQTYDGTQTKDVIFDKVNSIFAGSGSRVVETSSDGTLVATKPILETFTTDTDVITAITGGTYNKNSTFSDTIAPASSKVFYKGQMYKSSTYLYVATSDNVSYRTPLYGAETGWAIYNDNVYTSGSPLVINQGVSTKITNNANTVINNNLPLGVSSWWNSTTNKFTPSIEGDSYIVNLRFTAESSSITGLVDLECSVSGLGVIDGSTISLRKGVGNSQRISMKFDLYTATTFIANGGELFLNSIDGNTSIYDISIKITRVHKSIQ